LQIFDQSQGLAGLLSAQVHNKGAADQRFPVWLVLGVTGTPYQDGTFGSMLNA